MTARQNLDVIARFSYKGGLELLERTKPHLLREVERAVRTVDPVAHMTKESRERRTMGRMFYAPRQMNKPRHDLSDTYLHSVLAAP